MLRTRALHIVLLLTIAKFNALAGDPAAKSSDKSAYNLFRPVPADQLRDLEPDRPDKTESPYTVDPGHLQVEMDLAAYTRDRHNPERADVRFDSWSFANTSIRVGLLKNLEFD